MVLMIILVNVLLTTLVVIVTTRTTAQSIVLKNPMDVQMEFAVQMVEPVIIIWKVEDMNVTAYHHGYPSMVVEEQLNHVLVTLVRIMEHVNHME